MALELSTELGRRRTGRRVDSLVGEEAHHIAAAGARELSGVAADEAKPAPPFLDHHQKRNRAGRDEEEKPEETASAARDGARASAARDVAPERVARPARAGTPPLGGLPARR